MTAPSTNATATATGLAKIATILVIGFFPSFNSSNDEIEVTLPVPRINGAEVYPSGTMVRAPHTLVQCDASTGAKANKGAASPLIEMTLTVVSPAAWIRRGGRW
jgi:hypothetical protein